MSRPRARLGERCSALQLELELVLGFLFLVFLPVPFLLP